MDEWVPITGHVLLMVWLALQLPGVRLAGRPTQMLFSLCVAVSALWLPVGGIPPIAWTRGVLGNLSVTTTLLLIVEVSSILSGHSGISPASTHFLFLLLGALGFLLYPTALGVSPWDAYSLGYRLPFLPAVLLSACLLAWFSAKKGAAWILCLVATAHIFQVLPYTNLWDYLMDPLIAGRAWIWMALSGGSFFLRQHHAGRKKVAKKGERRRVDAPS